MTTIKFNPSVKSNFQFQGTMDGAVYTFICTWNLAGERYYINCFDQNTNRIFTLPMIGSTDTNNVNLAGGYFLTSTLVFRTSTQSFEITP